MTNPIDLPSSKPPEEARDDLLEILRMLAHKLSQPLTSLRGSIEVALMGEIKASECRQLLEQSLEEFHRMAGILEVFRDVIEIEGPGEEVRSVLWTRSVEKSLKEAVSVDENCSLQYGCNAADEVWVKASPQHLDTVTRGLIHQVIKLGHGKRSVQIALSIRGENACLSIYDEGSSSDPETGSKTDRIQFSAAVAKPEDLEWWTVRRANERLGGSLKINRAPTTGRCYELRLPLAPSEVAGRAQPSEL